MKNKALFLLSVLLLVTTIAGCHKRSKDIKSPADARYAKIGVMIGSTGEAVALAKFPDASIQSFDDIMDAVAAIKSGQLDVVITSSPSALQIAKKNSEFICLPEALDHEDTSVAVKKSDDKLLAEVNRVIGELKANGTLADMNRRWFKKDLTPYDEREIVLPKDGQVLRIGVTAIREPFIFIDKNGRVTGFDGELARIIGAKLHRPVEFYNMKFISLIPALNAGKVDLIISVISATKERKKSVNFSEPYFINAQVMLVKKPEVAKTAFVPDDRDGGKKNQPEFSSAADLKEKRIGVLLGSVHDSYAIKTYPKATILQYRNLSDIVLAVKTGKIDAAIYTYDGLLDLFRTNDDLGMLDPPLFSVPVGNGFNRNNNALREKFNLFLREIKQNGVYDDMVNRWMTKGDTVMPSIKNTKKNGLLTVGVSSDKGLPFAILKDNKLIGFDIELSERFAAYLGKDLKFSDMEFGSLIAAASTNKIDMINTLMITEERKKQISFSDKYYDLRANVCALKKNLAAPVSTPGENDSKVATPTFFTGIVNSFQSNIMQENRWQLILDGLRVTVIISSLSTLFGTALGALVCFMRMSSHRTFKIASSIYISVLRGTPVLVFLMLIFYVVFASVNIDPVLVAVIAFGMNFAAYAAEVFRTGIESIDRGQTEAGISLGFSKIKTFLFIVLPQTVRRILPVYKGEIISLVKMTSIVGYIAVQDLTKASDIIRSRTFDAFFPLIMVAIMYFILSWILIVTLDYAERAMNPKIKRKQQHATR